MKKKTIILTLLFFSTKVIFAQDVNYEWAKFMWGGTVTPTNTVSDLSGNLYVAASFEGGYNFNATPTGNTYDLEANCIFNGTDFICYRNTFVQKLNTNGSSVWLKKIGNNNTVIAKRITIDTNGNLIVLGNFSGEVDFDPGTGISTLNANIGAYFILKLNADGEFQWVKQLGVNEAIAIAADNTGNIYTVGAFTGTVDFDPSATVVNGTSNGLQDIFIHKLNTNGDFVWVKNIGGVEMEIAETVVADNDGDIYTTGFFNNGTVDFDPGAGVFNLTAVNRRFVLKLDANGNFLWAIQSPTADISSTALDSNKNLFITGFFQNTVDFDPSASVASLTSMGSNDIYIEKLNTNGVFQWVRQIMGATDNDRSSAITTDATGAVYTTGQFYDTVNFNPITTNSIVTSLGGYDGFIQKLDTNGAFQWVKIIGGLSTQSINSITTDSNENIYTTGNYYDQTDFDPNAGTVNLTTSNATNFILKLAPTTLGLNEVSKNDIKIYPNPSKGIFYLDLGNYVADELIIYDSLGNQIIRETNSTSKYITLNVSAGIYFIKIRVNNNKMSNKIVIQ
ncbi:SBBP repeat-containing protein [Flavobacterium sp.]